jgi:hypothetical protein
MYMTFNQASTYHMQNGTKPRRGRTLCAKVIDRSHVLPPRRPLRVPLPPAAPTAAHRLLAPARTPGCGGKSLETMCMLVGCYGHPIIYKATHKTYNKKFSIEGITSEERLEVERTV